MAVACSTVAFKGPIEEALRRIAANGFRHADLICIAGFGQIKADELLADFEGRASGIEAVLRETDLTPIAMNMGFGNLHDRRDPAAVERRKVEASAMARLMRRLNVPIASFYPGYKAAADRPWADVLADEVAGIGDLLAVAGDAGVRFVVEPHYNTVMQTLDQNRDILDALPDLHVAYDASHFVMQGIDLADTRFIMERALHMHARDAAPGRMCVPTGEGATDFDALLAQVASTGFAGNWSIEYLPDDSGSIERSITKLREMIEKA